MRIVAVVLSAVCVAAVSAVGCGDDSDEAGADGDTDTDTDTDTDSDSDSDGVCSGEDPFDPEGCPEIDSSDPRVRYVQLGGVGDGTSWAAAFDEVQPGIDACRCVALALGGTCQVWVAAGSYSVHAGCKQDTLRLRPGVECYGGFAGGETALEQRDWVANETVLDGQGTEIADTDSAPELEPYYVSHVVTGSDDAVLDGFTVTHGRAMSDEDFSDDARGAGMFNDAASPIVANCAFVDNLAQTVIEMDVEGASGGGMYNRNSSPIVTASSFLWNTVGSYALAQGGGVYNEGGSPEFTDCTFEENGSGGVMGGYGGGMANSSSSPAITRCSFVVNTGGCHLDNQYSSPVIRNCWFSENWEGGVCNEDSSSPWIENSVFFGNSGDGIRCVNGSSPTITNCVLIGNTGGTAGVSAYDSSHPTVSNSIVFGNDPGQIFADADSSCEVSYSLVEGGYAGDGNVDADPLFVDAGVGDFHLSPGSPCIDAADGDAAPEFDIEGNARFDDPATADTGVGAITYADMGAYEYQGE